VGKSLFPLGMAAGVSSSGIPDGWGLSVGAAALWSGSDVSFSSASLSVAGGVASVSDPISLSLCSSCFDGAGWWRATRIVGKGRGVASIFI
jgi:hypothetical protein